MLSPSSDEVIGHVRIVTGRLIPRSRSRPDYCTSAGHLFRTILSIATATGEVALIHEFVSGRANGSPVDRLVELRCKLLLRSCPGPHLHAIHVDCRIAIVLAVVLASSSHTVVA